MKRMADLRERLRRDRVWPDPTGAELLAYRKDVLRIADGMERGDGRPWMLWSGIPFPQTDGPLVCNPDEWFFLISVGGTKTDVAFTRWDGDEVIVLGPDGVEYRGAAVDTVREELRIPTPSAADTDDGFEMLEKIVRHAGVYLRTRPELLARCRDVFLSWGFAHEVVRSSEAVLGGIRAPSSELSKGQGEFTKELRGLAIDELFADRFARELGWQPRITVANDGVMALHYFLTPERLERYAQFGLFINGTGSNLAMAEPYAVRSEGVVSRRGENYQPERLTRYRALREGERLERYFVNFESATIELVATQTPYDQETDYPIEENAISGGTAFTQEFREIVRALVGEELYTNLTRASGGSPTGAQIATLSVASGKPAACEAVASAFPGAPIEPEAAEDLATIARAIVERSAFHVALILAALSARNGFGFGDPSGRPDLLALEGSVWRTEGYADRVRSYWEVLAGRPLAVVLEHEPSFNASLPGPLHLARLAST